LVAAATIFGEEPDGQLRIGVGCGRIFISPPVPIRRAMRKLSV